MQTKMKQLKALARAALMCIRAGSISPLQYEWWFQKPIDFHSTRYVLCKLKHEAHLLEKCTKNTYKAGQGSYRAQIIQAYLDELHRRKCSESEILNWAETILKKYETWCDQKKQQLSFSSGASEKIDVPNDFFITKSVRFWNSQPVERSKILSSISVAQLASASCNRQAFVVGIQWNQPQNTVLGEALNASLFSKAPARLFLFVNRFNYSEKYASVIDVGMFAQNFVLKAKNLGLSTCCCYASEYIDRSQTYWRKSFGLSREYYCYMTILIGYGVESPEKPPRCSLESIVLESYGDIAESK